MVDSNLQREVILPSEKAKAYKMRLDAMKRQGQRTDLTCAPVEHKLETKKSRDILAEKSGDSREQIRRYIRLNELIPEMLELVDEGKMAMRPAVEISYFPKDRQEDLYEAIRYNDCTPSHDQTIRMRKALNDDRLTKEVVDTIMEEEKPNQREKSPLIFKVISSLFLIIAVICLLGLTPKQISEDIISMTAKKESIRDRVHAVRTGKKKKSVGERLVYVQTSLVGMLRHTTVKSSMFNGISLPSIALFSHGKLTEICTYGFNEYFLLT